jgi:uncharacterized protein (TIRG00374 family)
MRQISHRSGWQYRAVVISVVMSAIGYLGFSLWIGWQDVSAAVGHVGFVGIVLALVMSLINYALRFVRWQGYLHTLGHPVPWLPSLKIYLAGFALTTTPGKAGEALRGFLLRKHDVPYSTSFAAFFSERLSDLFAIVLLTLFGLTLYPDATPVIAIGVGLVLIGLLALSQRRLIERLATAIPENRGALLGMVKHMFDVMIEAQRCNRLGMLIFATVLSVIAWTAEALAFYWILGWMGATVSITFAVFVYAISMLVGALSFMPGGLGGAEAVMVALLIWKGMSSPDAIAATIVIRLATLWFAVAIGAAIIPRLVNR